MDQSEDPARRVDAPTTDAEQAEVTDLPYDPEMTEPDEGNVPDTQETGGANTASG